MKIRIKTYNGELPSYLSKDKRYEIEYIMGGSFFITTCFDDPEYISVTMSNCNHLNGGSWEVVSE